MYFANSPRRIGLVWFLIHLGVLLVGIFCISQADFTAIFSLNTFVLAAAMIVFFPFAFLLNLPGLSLPEFLRLTPFAISLLYYILFIVLLRKAKNTQSRSFRIILAIFTILFIVNTISSFYFVFDQLVEIPVYSE